MYQPKSFGVFKDLPGYFKKGTWLKDLIAGIIVAIIALPLSIALAISSGVSPEKGLITAFIAGFCISFFGGSDVQIGGPTGAFVVIICGIIAGYGIDGLIISTLMAGIFLILFGVFKLGNVIKYIPYTITVGFTTGIAVTLMFTQVNDLLGLNIANIPSEFIPKWGAYFANLSNINWWAAFIGILTIAISFLWPKINKKIPGSLIALIVTTAIVIIFKIPVNTIETQFGEISGKLPLPTLPPLSIDKIISLLSPAFTIALLAAIESLLSAVVADGMTGKKHDSNAELIGQGIANVAVSFFGGIPATGAIARTAANIKNGGKTPMAGIIHAVTLFLIMLIFMPYAKLIPMSTLAGILVVVSYNMAEIKSMKTLLKSSKSDALVMMVTFILTVIFDLVVAIEIGMILALVLIVMKVSENTTVKESSVIDSEKYKNDKIMIYEINGPLFFGAASNFIDVLGDINTKLNIVIFDMSKMTVMDATAHDALTKIEKRCRAEHILPMFVGVQEQPLKIISNLGGYEGIKKEMFFESIDEAYIEAESIVELNKKVKAKGNKKQ
ncbi:MAG: STAS domain-containing protein [Ruminococcaceae bacterium]|nr:STAS domain-containing protein [Oscillospiraceae bacterium]